MSLGGCLRRRSGTAAGSCPGRIAVEASQETTFFSKTALSLKTALLSKKPLLSKTPLLSENLLFFSMLF